MENDRKPKIEIREINGKTVEVTVLPSKKPEAVRKQIGATPEGQIGRVGKKAKVAGGRK